MAAERKGASVGWEERLPGLSFYGEGRSRGGDGSGVGNAGVGDVLERGCVSNRKRQKASGLGL